jgi:deoxyribonuclease V
MRMRRALSHSWAVSVQEAFRVQEELVSELVLDDVEGEPATFGGIDVAFDRRRDLLYAAIVVLDAASMRVVEVAWTSLRPTFPYVPGLLSFREGPVVSAAWDRLATTPDLLFFDGQGIAHPRGLGLASHMGILLDRPSIGCAKSRLIGEFKEPKQKRGSMRTLQIDRRKVGVVLRTKDNTRPLFVSPGHRVSIETAARRVLDACRGYRLPEPTRIAHITASRAKRGELGPGN